MREGITALLCLLILLSGCVTKHVERENITAETFRTTAKIKIEEMKTQSPFLKAHMKNGNLYVFNT